jgi:hypothetical protein
MQQLPTQQEMAFPAGAMQDPDYYFATRLISQVQRDLQRSNRRHLMITSRWLIAYEYLKTLEERLLIQDSPLEREKAFFNGTVAVMLGLGRLLLQQLEGADNLCIESLGISLNDISACVAELEDIERAAHREWDKREVETLDAAFGIRSS